MKDLSLADNYGVSQELQSDLADDIIDVIYTWLLDEFKDDDYV